MDWELKSETAQHSEIKEDGWKEKSRPNRNRGEVKKSSAKIKKADLNLPVWRDEVALTEKMADDSPESEFKIVVDNKLTIPKRFLTDELVSLLKERLIFQNPGYFNRARFGKLKRGEEPWIFCIWQSKDGHHLFIPRGFTHDLVNILHSHRLKPELVDHTRKPQQVDFVFQGRLYAHQEEALKALRPYRFGILQGGMRSGKKVLCLKLICERRCRTLVVVKTKKQMYQWASLVQSFIKNGAEHFGYIADGRQDLNRNITVAIDRSLYRHLPDVLPTIDFLVVDQCHLANIKIFYRIVLLMDAAYMIGLSTVSKRGDGLDKMMSAFIGPIRCEMKLPESHDSTPKPIMIVHETNYFFDYRENYGEMIRDLVGNEERNNMIITDILQDMSRPKARGVLISERLEHLEVLKGLLQANYKESRILNSRVLEKQRIQLFQDFDHGALQIILTTLKSLSDMEVRYVNCIYLAAPVKIGEHLSQVISRLMMVPQGDEPGKIYEYLDRGIDVLRASFARRLKFYRLVGFQDTRAKEV